MRLDGVEGDHEIAGDSPFRLAFGEQCEDL
jgi:hypothetical protein